MKEPSYLSRGVRGPEERFWYTSPEIYLNNYPLVVAYSGYSHWRKGHEFSRTDSSICSVEVVTGGNARLVQNGKEYLVQPGQAFILHKGGTHLFQTGPAGFLRKRMAILDGVMLDVVLQSLRLASVDVVTLDRAPEVYALIKQCNRLCGTPSRESAWQLSLLAYELLLRLGQTIHADKRPEAVMRALDYMNSNIKQKMTLEQLAARSGLSVYRFSHLFTESVGCAPLTYFHKQKIGLAENLLANSALLVKEIATILGYRDPLYFSAQFKKNAGCSPRAYREGNRGE